MCISIPVSERISVAAGAAMTLLGQGQPKALWPIGPTVVPQVTDDHKLLEREDHSETTREGQVPKDMKEYGIEGLMMSQKRPGGNGRDQ